MPRDAGSSQDFTRPGDVSPVATIVILACMLPAAAVLLWIVDVWHWSFLFAPLGLAGWALLLWRDTRGGRTLDSRKQARHNSFASAAVAFLLMHLAYPETGGLVLWLCPLAAILGWSVSAPLLDQYRHKARSGTGLTIGEMSKPAFVLFASFLLFDFLLPDWIDYWTLILHLLAGCALVGGWLREGLRPRA